MMILRKSRERDTFLCHMQLGKRGRERNETKKIERSKEKEQVMTQDKSKTMINILTKRERDAIVQND